MQIVKSGPKLSFRIICAVSIHCQRGCLFEVQGRGRGGAGEVMAHSSHGLEAVGITKPTIAPKKNGLKLGEKMSEEPVLPSRASDRMHAEGQYLCLRLCLGMTRAEIDVSARQSPIARQGSDHEIRNCCLSD